MAYMDATSGMLRKVGIFESFAVDSLNSSAENLELVKRVLSSLAQSGLAGCSVRYCISV